MRNGAHACTGPSKTQRNLSRLLSLREISLIFFFPGVADKRFNRWLQLDEERIVLPANTIAGFALQSIQTFSEQSFAEMV